MVERRLTGMITAAVVLIVLFILWDAFKPTPRRANLDPDADAPLRVAEPPPAPPSQVPQQTTPPTTTSQGTAVPAGPNGREPSYIELLARSETRRRIRSRCSRRAGTPRCGAGRIVRPRRFTYGSPQRMPRTSNRHSSMQSKRPSACG